MEKYGMMPPVAKGDRCRLTVGVLMVSSVLIALFILMGDVKHSLAQHSLAQHSLAPAGPLLEEVSVPSKVERIRIFLQENPGVENLGCLVAKEQGFFEQEGLPPVELVWDVDYLYDCLFDGRADFRFAWMAEGVMKRASGRKVVAVALMTQGTSACMMLRSDLHPTIDSLDKLKGKKIAIWQYHELTAKTFLASKGIVPHYVVQRAETNFLFDEELVTATFSTDYSFAFLSKYTPYRDNVLLFRFSDYGCDFPENALFCRELFLETHPDICQKVVAAIFKGWGVVVNNPDEALNLLLTAREKVHRPSDRFVLRQQLDIWLPLLAYNQKLEANGQCDQARYERLIQAMIKGNIVKAEQVPRFFDLFRPVLK